MIKKQFRCTIIGKTTELAGWIFKKQVYKIAVRIEVDPKPTATYSIPFDLYCSLEVGDIKWLTMYSSNGHTWNPINEEL